MDPNATLLSSLTTGGSVSGSASGGSLNGNLGLKYRFAKTGPVQHFNILAGHEAFFNIAPGSSTAYIALAVPGNTQQHGSAVNIFCQGTAVKGGQTVVMNDSHIQSFIAMHVPQQNW